MSLRNLTARLRTEMNDAKPSLGDITFQLRHRLFEAKAKAEKTVATAVEAPASAGSMSAEDTAEKCLAAANFIRDCLKHGDKYEEAAAEVADIADDLAKATDALDTKRGALDAATKSAAFQTFLKSSGEAKAGTEDAAVSMKRAVDMLYVPYAKAREAIYELAAAWDISTKRTSEKGAPSADLKKQSPVELANGIAFASKNLQTNVRDFLEKGSTAQKLLRNAAKKIGLEGGELSDSEKQAVVNAGLDFRDSSAPMYGRAMGITRRVNELLDRARKLEKYEAANKALKIELEVADDEELGKLDMI